MNLYKVSQCENNGYDTWDAFVVASESADMAARYHPSPFGGGDGGISVFPKGAWSRSNYGWVKSPDETSVEFLGVSDYHQEGEIIIASFNAG